MPTAKTTTQGKRKSSSVFKSVHYHSLKCMMCICIVSKEDIALIISQKKACGTENERLCSLAVTEQPRAVSLGMLIFKT